MGLFDRFKKEKRNYDPFLTSTFAVNYAGEIVNSNTSLQCPPFVSAVNLLSTSLAKLGRHVMKDGGRIEGHPVEKLLKNPNPFIDGYTFFQQADLQRLNEGNAYIHITRNNKGIASQLMLINPSFVSMRIDGNEIHYLVRMGDKQLTVEPKDMIHVKSPFMDMNALKGIGYHSVLKEQIGLWLTAQKHQSRYFAVGSDPTSLLTTDEKLSPDKRTEVREAWEKVNSNDNRMRVAVLDGGFKFTKLGSNFSDLEMNDMFSELTKQIASTFNISPVLIGHDGSKNTYSNIEQQNMNFLQQSLMPGITAWEHQLQKLFGENSSYYVQFNYESLLRADSSSRAERLTKLVSANIITTNEAREYEGLPPVEVS
ncbi:phage portal protein [Bacillus mobilis]|uniref:Phage portal protein n=1 Tax=Bacillus mobilis TaxID=2026190 RepID=A0ABV4S287_9BACI